MKSYIVAAIKSWNRIVFEKNRGKLAGHWELVDQPSELEDAIERLKPRYVFFPHWSWKVPVNLLTRTECVCFHMTDLPYGRGGSPLQNLIVRGHAHTCLTALRMVETMDAGPLYAKVPISLDGSAQEIYERVAGQTWSLIAKIVNEEPTPTPQRGEPVIFVRRNPDKSGLPMEGDCKAVYDHIRMLDAEGYPRAFLDWGVFRLEFKHAIHEKDGVVATVVIRNRTARV